MGQSLTVAAKAAHQTLLAGGREGARLEAKRVREKVDRAVWETVSAFANADGGLLLLGIDEKKGWTVTDGFNSEQVMQRLKAGLEASAKADPKVTPIPRYEIDYVDLGDAHKAIDYCEQSLDIAREIEYREVEADALFNMSQALEKLAKRQEAIHHAKAALEIFEQIESPKAEEARRKLSDWQG